MNPQIKALVEEVKSAALPLAIRDVRVRIQRMSHPEAFRVFYRAGQLEIFAESDFGAATGLYQQLMAVQSGIFLDEEEERVPSFSLRPLWVTSERVHFCASMCQRLVECGYNALVMNFRQVDSAVTQQTKEYGLKLIAQVETQRELEQLLSNSLELDGIFWSGKAKKSAEETQLEQHCMQLRNLEEACLARCPLIYYVPLSKEGEAEEQAKWMPALQDNAGKKTIIAFSALSGPAWENHYALHPLWEVLLKSPDCSATPLMPLLNVGGVDQGEGLWPVLTTEWAMRCVSKMRRHPFAGILSLTRHIPKRGGLLDCNLWVAGQLQWRGSSEEVLLERWFAARGASVSGLEPFKAATQLWLRIRCLKSETTRCQVEGIVAQLKRLRELVNENVLRGSPFSGYFRYYLRDIGRYFLHGMQQLRLPLLGWSLEETEPSFWSSLGEGGQLLFHKEPMCLKEQAEMVNIYQDNLSI